MKSKFFLKGLLIGGGLAIFFTVAGLFLMSIWVGNGSQPVYYLVNNLLFLSIFSLLVGGFYAGYSAGMAGWLHGTIIGLFYACLFLIAPWLWLQDFSWQILLKETFFFAALTAFAGSAGVNYQGYRLRRRRIRRMY